MKILITGGAGYIGSHTAVALIEAGYEPIIADDFSNSHPAVADRLRKITGATIPVYECDVCSAEALDLIFVENDVGAVIHFAGFKAVGESVAQPLKYYKNNINSAVSVLNAMDRYGVKRMIFSSSATVYGTENPVPYAEEMPTGNCSNPYGWTKLMIEQIITDYSASVPGFSAALLRYFNPLGAHESGLIGEMPNGIPNNLMPYITQVAAGRLKTLSVFGSDYPTPDGTCIRDYIHIMDLAEGHVAALKWSLENTGARAFNLGTGHGLSVLELVRAFMDATGVNVPYRMSDRRPGDLPSYYADASRASAELGWKACRGPVEMCRDAWNWQKMNPDGYDTKL